MARIVRLHAFGGPEHLRIEELASGRPGKGEVRLRVQAARVTRDHYSFLNGRQFQGHGFAQPTLPSRLGYEAREYVLGRLATGRLAPRVAKTLPLEGTVDAHRFVLTNDQMGTVILECAR